MDGRVTEFSYAAFADSNRHLKTKTLNSTRIVHRVRTIITTLMLLGCALLAMQARSVSAQTRGGTLNFVVTPEPTSLVAIATTAVNVLKVSPKVLEGLLDYDFSLNPKPLLATSWEITDSGKRYVFHLRHDVRWQDGKPFTSADVAYSIETLRVVHPRAKTTFANVTAITTPDPYTVVLTLSKPTAYLIRGFSASETPIFPKHIYAGTDVLSNPANNAPIGTGPFRFVKWVHGSYIEYARNDDYWDKGKPYIDKLIVKVIADPAARTVAFDNGSADIGGDSPVPLSDIGQIKQNPKLGIDTRGYDFEAGLSRLEFNLDNQYLKNLKVRQAIASALDRNIISKVVFYGYAVPNASPILPNSPYYDATPSPYSFDVARANALLDQAGFPRKADGVRFTLTLDALPIGDLPTRTASYIRSALSHIGIAVTVRTQDLPSYLRHVYTNRDFDFAINGMSNLFDPVVGVARLYTTSNFRRGVPFTNASHYSNPEIDTLFDQVAVETDEAKRRALFIEIQQILEQDVPDVNLVSPKYVTVYNKAVHDATTSPDGLSGSFANVWLQR